MAGTGLVGRVRAGLALVSPGGKSPVGEYDFGLVAGLVPASEETAVCLSTQWRSRSRRTAPRYEALSKLSAATAGFEIRSAAIVERDKGGHLHVPEGGDTTAGAGPMGQVEAPVGK